LLRASGRIQAGRFKPGAAELDHSFTGYRSVRNPQVALSRAGDVAVRLDASQQVLHRGFIVSGIASALCITFFIRLRPHVMPTIPAMDFVVLSLFLGPILEESVFRSFLLPVLAPTLGDVASVIATAVLFAAFHGPSWCYRAEVHSRSPGCRLSRRSLASSTHWTRL
jgi:hypothetical protein